MTELSVEIDNTEEEISFDELTIIGYYSDYDLLEEEQELFEGYNLGQI